MKSARDDHCRHYDVVVVGAGIVGVTTAHALARAGMNVAVVEQWPEPAAATSFANGGMITPSMAEPWAQPGLPGKLPGWMLDEDAPFLVRPRALPGAFRWGLDFLKNCTLERWQINSRRLLALSQFSQRCLNEVVTSEGLHEHIDSCGSLRLYADAQAAQHAAPELSFVRSHGVEARSMTAEEIVSIEPALAEVASRFACGVYYPGDQVGDCREFTKAMAQRCERRGVSFFYGVSASRIIRDGARQVSGLAIEGGFLKAKAVVLATGMPSRALAEDQVRRLRCYPIKGYSVSTFVGDSVEVPRIAIVDDLRKVGVVRLGGILRIVGTAELCGNDTSINPRRLAGLTHNAAALIPSISARSFQSSWAGLRATTPDGSPYVGAIDANGLFANLGHGHLGWTNACGAAALICALITGAAIELDPAPFAPRLH